MENSNKGGRPRGTPKTGGRKKGTPNKTTVAVRTWLVELIGNNREQIKKDLQNIEPKERLLILEKFMQYVVPKRQALEADISLLTDAELSEVAAQMLDQIKAEENGNSVE